MVHWPISDTGTRTHSSHCKRIRTNSASWQQITQHTVYTIKVPDASNMLLHCLNIDLLAYLCVNWTI